MGECGYREPLNFSQHTAHFIHRRLSPPMPFPQNIANLRPEQVRCEQVSRRKDPSCGACVVFAQYPFNRDAGIDDDWAHRESRSSRISSALSLKVLPFSSQ